MLIYHYKLPNVGIVNQVISRGVIYKTGNLSHFQSSAMMVAGISFGGKQMKSKAFWLLGLVAIAAVALAACGGGG